MAGGDPVLSPVFRVAFVKFGGLLALVVLSVSSNVCLGLKGCGKRKRGKRGDGSHASV